MSRALRTVGTVLGGAALVAGTIATGGGLGIVAAATAGKIAAFAGAASAVANIGAQLTAPTPPARGSTRFLTLAPP